MSGFKQALQPETRDTLITVQLFKMTVSGFLEMLGISKHH